jgi:hypothetical protein
LQLSWLRSRNPSRFRQGAIIAATSVQILNAGINALILHEKRSRLLGACPRGMHRFMVNCKSAIIFKGVLESWIRSKSGKKFAEMLWTKNAGRRVYYILIKLDKRLREMHGLLREELGRRIAE